MSSELLAKTLTRDQHFRASAVPAADLLRALATNRVDLVVISADLSQRSRNAFDLVHRVVCAHPNVFVVVLLNDSSPVSVIDSFRSGARGVFCRQRPISEFLDCVDRVRKGFIWAGGHEADALLQLLRNMPATSFVQAEDAPPLTDRELQVVQHAATGKTNKMIANELHLSEHTVKNYLFKAFEKLGVSSRVELLFYLTMRGYVFGSDEPRK
jgi:DNA-binding NarL/FixJ family response regulator